MGTRWDGVTHFVAILRHKWLTSNDIKLYTWKFCLGHLLRSSMWSQQPTATRLLPSERWKMRNQQTLSSVTPQSHELHPSNNTSLSCGIYWRYPTANFPFFFFLFVSVESKFLHVFSLYSTLHQWHLCLKGKYVKLNIYTCTHMNNQKGHCMKVAQES